MALSRLVALEIENVFLVSIIAITPIKITAQVGSYYRTEAQVIAI